MASIAAPVLLLRRRWGSGKYLDRENWLISSASKETVNSPWLYHCSLAQLASTPLWDSKSQRCLHFWGTLGSVVKGVPSQCLPCYAVNYILASSHFPFHLSLEPFICDYFLAPGLSVSADIELAYSYTS